MYIVDGIAHAEQPEPEKRLDAAKVVNDLCMLVRFSTGEVRVFDAAPLLKNEAFTPLAEASTFQDFSIEHGVLCWRGGDIDISPNAVYDMSYRYEITA